MEAVESRRRDECVAIEAARLADIAAVEAAFSPLVNDSEWATGLGNFLLKLKIPQYHRRLSRMGITIRTVTSRFVDEQTLCLQSVSK